MQTTERLFSYGTLQQEDVQRALFGRALDGAPDALVGYARRMIAIADPDVVAKSGRAAHPIVCATGEEADRVTGAVFVLTPEELAAADAYEVDAYERVAARLASGVTAWVYVMRVSPGGDARRGDG